MIERFYSGDYPGKFCAVCDELDLPFWKISCFFQSKNARPFVYYVDGYGNKRVAVGGKGDTHNDIFGDMIDLGVKRYDTLCGRIWNLKKKILTVWDDSSIRFLNSSTFSDMADLLSEEGFEILNANLIFEVNDDNTLKSWTYSNDGFSFYIYSIPVEEFISLKVSSFDEVVKLYEMQERKRSSASASLSHSLSWHSPKVNHFRYQSDENKSMENKNILNEGVLADNLPEDIKMSLLNNTTSLGNNPAIPDVYDTPFLLRLANGRFNEIKDYLINMGEIDDFEDTEINSMLTKLIKKCQEIERPFRNELEKLCVNYVIDTFNVPDDVVQINVELVDNVNLNAQSIIVDPLDGDEDFEFDDVNSASNIRKEVYKRRILESLCMGGAISLSSNIDSYNESIEKISPELCELYNKIIALNNYALYMQEDLGIDDKNKKQLGTVNVEFGNNDQQVRVTAQGKIFPVLLSETLRGFMELFISHGLPKDLEMAKIIIGKSDFLKAEPWDMRLGPSLWVLLTNSFNDITLPDLPYLLKRIASLDTDNFNFLMKEVFAKTKKGRLIMSKICKNAKNDIDYDKFTDKMDKMKLDKSVIIDEFINEDEL